MMGMWIFEKYICDRVTCNRASVRTQKKFHQISSCQQFESVAVKFKIYSQWIRKNAVVRMVHENRHHFWHLFDFRRVRRCALQIRSNVGQYSHFPLSGLFGMVQCGWGVTSARVGWHCVMFVRRVAYCAGPLNHGKLLLACLSNGNNPWHFQ